MIAISLNKNQIGLQQFLTNWKRTAWWAKKWHSNGFQGPGKGSSSPRVEYGEPELDLRPEEAIFTSTRTLWQAWGGGPWEWRTLGMADPGDGKPGGGGPWGWRAVTAETRCEHTHKDSNVQTYVRKTHIWRQILRKERHDLKQNAPWNHVMPSTDRLMET